MIYVSVKTYSTYITPYSSHVSHCVVFQRLNAPAHRRRIALKDLITTEGLHYEHAVRLVDSTVRDDQCIVPQWMGLHFLHNVPLKFVARSCKKQVLATNLHKEAHIATYCQISSSTSSSCLTAV